MMLIPQLISIKYEKNSSDINEMTILSIEEYKDGTKLDIEAGIVLPIHYRVNQEYYSLSFQLDVEKSEIKNYKIIQTSLNPDIPSIEYYYDEKNNIFHRGNLDNKLVNIKDYSYNTSGRYSVELFYHDTLIKSVPVLLIPSSMTYQEYIQMIKDLINIKEDLVIEKNSNIGLFKKWETKLELIEQCINNISNSINSINQCPHTKIISHSIQLPYQKITKFSEKILIQQALNPLKTKYSTIGTTESKDILEHQLIKSTLIKLQDKVKAYIQSFQTDILNESDELDKVIHRVEKSFNVNYLDEKRRIENELKNLNQRCKEIEKKTHQLIFKRKQIKIEFSFFKQRQQNHSTISFEIKDNGNFFTLKIISSRKDCIWGLDLARSEYTFCDIDERNYKKSRFKTQKLNLKFYTKDLNQIIQLVSTIEQANENSYIKLNANILINDDKNEYDPFGGKILPNYRVEVRDFTIYMVSINRINDAPVRMFSEQERLEFFKKYVIKDDNDTVDFLDTIDYKKQFYNKSINKNNGLLDKIEALLNKDVLKSATYTSDPIKPTQVFLNDIHYRNIYLNLNQLDKVIDFQSEYDHDFILLKSTCDIYEIWCLYKIVDVLINELGFTLLNKEEVLQNLKNILEENKKLSKKLTVKLRKLGIKSSHGNFVDKIDFTLDYEEKIYYTEHEYKTPDFKITISMGNVEKIFYIDAKYRNYEDQGANYFAHDIVEVAFKKYILPYFNSINEPASSMIIHSYKDDHFVDYEGTKFISNKNQYPLKPHSLGGFYLVPSNVNFLRIYLRLIFEYHLNQYEFCWTCGEMVNITKTTKKTQAGKDKYHYKCDSCQEFWVKTHCSNDSKHKIIKHLFNYHSNNQKKYPWYVDCPECKTTY